MNGNSGISSDLPGVSQPCQLRHLSSGNCIFPLHPLEQNRKSEINPERRERSLTGDSSKDAKGPQSWGRPVLGDSARGNRARYVHVRIRWDSR